MSQIISLDAHKRYSLAGVETVDGKRVLEDGIAGETGQGGDRTPRSSPLPIRGVLTEGLYMRSWQTDHGRVLRLCPYAERPPPADRRNAS